MRYVKTDRVPGWLERRMDSVESIERGGSVRGMQNRFGWPRGGQVRVGAYIYNVGPEYVQKLRDRGLLSE